MRHIIHEDLLFSRHFRLPKACGLSIEFTQDESLLHQYYALRSLNLADSPAKLRIIESTENDNRAQIVVVRLGSQVVGGGRIIIRQSQDDSPLSIEHENFSIAQALPDLKIGNNAYGEISKIFLLEEYQSDSIIHGMYQCITAKLKELRVRFAFAKCQLPILADKTPTQGYYRITIYQNFTPNLAPAHLPSYERLAIMDVEPVARQPLTQHNNNAIHKLIKEIAALT